MSFSWPNISLMQNCCLQYRVALQIFTLICVWNNCVVTQFWLTAVVSNGRLPPWSHITTNVWAWQCPSGLRWKVTWWAVRVWVLRLYKYVENTRYDLSQLVKQNWTQTVVNLFFRISYLIQLCNWREVVWSEEFIILFRIPLCSIFPPLCPGWPWTTQILTSSNCFPS